VKSNLVSGFFRSRRDYETDGGQYTLGGIS
jgi:hypothetical protein